MVIAGLEDRQVKYLGETHEGKKHDKKIADEERLELPEGCEAYRDTAFQGHGLPGVIIHQPKKKPRGGELTETEKQQNALISSIRVVVEHVIAGIKRCRVVKDKFRNTAENYDNMVMELACGLHNFRTHCRLNSY